MQWIAPPVKELAEQQGIPVAQPEHWRDGQALAQLKDWQPDLVITAAYGKILPQAALEIPKLGCINVHASLLPRWRGADPIRRAILAGDPETGITIMEMVLEMDAGDILWQKRLALDPDETLQSLENRLAELGGATLSEALKKWRAGQISAVPQDPKQVTMAPMSRKADGKMLWTETAEALERRVRAFSPWPGAVTSFGAQPLRLWAVRIADPQAPAAPGEILAIEKTGFSVGTGHGSLSILEVQPAGKKRMPAADWARGARLQPGEKLGK